MWRCKQLNCFFVFFLCFYLFYLHNTFSHNHIDDGDDGNKNKISRNSFSSGDFAMFVNTEEYAEANILMVCESKLNSAVQWKLCRSYMLIFNLATKLELSY